MAHEINNPLAGILQSLQVVERRLSDDTGANQRAAAEAGCPLSAIRAFLDRREITGLLQHIRESGVRAARIVSNMLEFSRKQESTKVPALLPELLDRAVELCAQDYDPSRKYDFRKILIARDYDQCVPPVPCTATLIEQVFMNILRNAAQAMGSRTGEGPPPRIALRTRLEHGSARVEVEDNGPGMDETSLRKVFEPFFTTKPVGEGTGLGLSVSYFIIVNNHDGRFEVRSEPGKGTCFIIHLPLRADG